MFALQGKLAVVTGAGSGIGRALAQLLDEKGCRLALSDINEKGLAETAALLKTPPHVQALDVAMRGDFYDYAKTVQKVCGDVDLVINNAGVSLSQNIVDMHYDDFEWLMGINFWGVVHGTKAFLPGMLARKEGRIVNVSSVFGLIGVPTQGAYNAAKFAVRGFTEALRHELEGTGVAAICVHPGGIKTNIVKNARWFAGPEGTGDKAGAVKNFEKLARTTPAQAAETIVRGIERGSQRILIGSDAVGIDVIQRLRPENYWKSLSALMKPRS